MRLAVAIATLAALAAAPARSAEQPQQNEAASPAPQQSSPGSAAKPPPPEASDLAKALLTSQQWGKILDSYASSLSGQISQSLLNAGEKVPDDLKTNVRAELEKALPYQQTVKAQAEALSKELTPDELRRTATFYKSPLGKKVLDRLPQAQSEVAHELQGKLATAVPDIVNKLAPKAMSSSPHGGAPGGGAESPQGSPPVQGRKPPTTTQ